MSGQAFSRFYFDDPGRNYTPRSQDDRRPGPYEIIRAGTHSEPGRPCQAGPLVINSKLTFSNNFFSVDLEIGSSNKLRLILLDKHLLYITEIYY